jgi:radical SAM protein with 4Fe4S-binding SPASM domain
MPAVKNNILIGVSRGRFVLVPSDMALPTKYLSEASSVMLTALLSSEGDQIRKQILETVFPNLGLPELSNIRTELLNELEPYLFDECHDRRLSFKQLIMSKNKKRNIKTSLFKLDYPIELVVVPTWQCNRNCAYCGVPKIKPGSRESRIDSDLLLERLLDAVSKGVQSIKYHGGEPILFYENIFKQIKILCQHGVLIKISTKNYISTKIAIKLADTGLTHLQLSIDTIDPELSRFLYNDALYSCRLIKSIDNLLRVGIQPHINVVVSKINYRGIPDLLLFLNDHRIREVELSNFRKGCINDKRMSLDKKEQIWLYHAIKRKCSDLCFDLFKYYPFNEPVISASDRPICESGRIGFLFLPNGDGCYCDFLAENSIFHVGNLENQTVGDIWDSSELNNFVFPSNDIFYGTRCKYCAGFEYCSNRGFCYVQTNGKYMPDFKCKECYL